MEEIFWQVAKILLGLFSFYVVIRYDLRKPERACGVLMLTSGLAILSSGIVGFFARPVEALWIGRASLAILLVSMGQWLRLRDKELRCKG